MKILINFCIALAVAGCIPVNTHYGSDLSSMDTFTIEKDKTTEQELIDRLGKPQTSNISADFASLLRREASAFFPFRPEYHRFASLIVLKAPDVPSILFETGYLTNAVDSAYIQSDEGRKQIALGMRRAIEAHFARRMIHVARR